jgi:tetratricopeptide (TPR) repeat protein
VRARLAEGDRTEARARLETVLSADSLDVRTRTEAQFLAALLEPGGVDFRTRLGELLETDPPPLRAAWIHLQLGQVAFWEGELETALTEFRTARELGREEEGALWEGVTAFALGDGDAARTALTRATASGQGAIRQRAWVVLGDTYRAGDDWVEAIAAYENVRREAPNGPGWWATATARQAECYEKLGAPVRAARLYEELLAQMPESYEAADAVARLPEAEALAAEPERDAEGEPAAGTTRIFRVQVGAFRGEDNARSLAERVRSAGFGPVEVRRGTDELYRVRVGRFDARPGAESLGDSLGAALGLGYSVVWGEEEP